eukprot:scaffold897_cov402-Prasinococcus_capsulatus_cf.AAC.67
MASHAMAAGSSVIAVASLPTVHARRAQLRVRACAAGKRMVSIRSMRTCAVCAQQGDEPDSDTHISELRRGLLLAGLASTIGLSGHEGRAMAGGVESLYDLTVMQYGKERSLSDFRNKASRILRLFAAFRGGRPERGQRMTLAERKLSGFASVRPPTPAELSLVPTEAYLLAQFGCQAPGTSEQEREYAWKKFGFEFPGMKSAQYEDKFVFKL